MAPPGDREATPDVIARWRRNETVAGAYALSLTGDELLERMDGAARCYDVPPDLTRITWLPRHMPTPFVGYAPVPGPLASGSINSMQFRYARELTVPKPPAVCRIFLTGGSTAFGVGASSNERTIGGYLETQLNDALRDQEARCEVVTAAGCAWSSSHERILIEHRLVDLQPDLVISFSGHNDAFWAARGQNVLWFRAFHDDYFLTLINAMLESNGADAFPSELDAAHPVSPAQAGERLARNIGSAHQALAAVGADYVFALQTVLCLAQKPLTAREQIFADYWNPHLWYERMPRFYDAFRRRITQLEPSGVQFVDTTGAFDGCDDRTDIFLDSMHFGDRGNELVARHLCPFILAIVEDRLARSASRVRPSPASLT